MPEWLYTLTIAATGYIPLLTDNERDYRLSGPLVFGTYEIQPIHFVVEMLDLYEPYERIAQTREGSALAPDDSLLAKTIRSAKTAAVRDITLAGVFATVKDSSFDFVTVQADLAPDIQQGAIIARDKSRRRFYGWDSFGTEITLYESNPKEPDNLKPKSSYVLKLSESAVASDPPAKCESKEGFVVTVSLDSGKPYLAVLPPPNSGWRLATPSVELPPEIGVTEIAACAGAVNSVYVALKDQGILKIEFVRATYANLNPKVAAFVSPKGSNGLLNFVSITLGTRVGSHSFGSPLCGCR